MTDEHIQWYHRISRCLSSLIEYTIEEHLFQPPNMSAWDVMVNYIPKKIELVLNIVVWTQKYVIHLIFSLQLERMTCHKNSSNEARYKDSDSIEHLICTTRNFVDEVSPVLWIPPYVVDPSAPQNTEANIETTRYKRQSGGRHDDVGSWDSNISRSKKTWRCNVTSCTKWYVIYKLMN